MANAKGHPNPIITSNQNPHEGNPGMAWGPRLFEALRTKSRMRRARHLTICLNRRFQS